MEGIIFGKEGKCIERVEKRTEVLSLLAKGDGVEVMLQKIQANVMFFLDPGEENLLEFFYIQSGEVSCESASPKISLSQGEYFYTKELKETTCFIAKTEVTMLYVASQPVFHLLSEEIKKLSEIRIKVEEKDMYTYEHDLRLQVYSYKVAERLGLSKEVIRNLSYSAVFHDLGKINVPIEILNKPGKLTKEEFEFIKKHPEDGVKIVKNTFIEDCGLGILQHHERLDGSGYPFGLKDNEICIEAKIIGVVDTYDAMTSDRPYRSGMDPKVAFSEIKGLAGKHYDKKVVDCLEKILKDDGVI